MPRREKINLEKVRASLFTLCTECGYKAKKRPRDILRDLKVRLALAVYHRYRVFISSNINASSRRADLSRACR
jgi:hypothetical protein